MKTKTTMQKLYEKYRMIELQAGTFAPAVAVRTTLHFEEGPHGPEGPAVSSREPGVYLTIDNMPVAKLLSQAELDETEPDFERSAILAQIFSTLEEHDQRDERSNWDRLHGKGFVDLAERMCGDQLPPVHFSGRVFEESFPDESCTDSDDAGK